SLGLANLSGWSSSCGLPKRPFRRYLEFYVSISVNEPWVKMVLQNCLQKCTKYAQNTNKEPRYAGVRGKEASDGCITARPLRLHVARERPLPALAARAPAFATGVGTWHELRNPPRHVGITPIPSRSHPARPHAMM